jgi:hypothetical protein
MPLIINKELAFGYTAAAVATVVGASFGLPALNGTNLTFVKSFQYTSDCIPVRFFEENELAGMSMQLSNTSLEEIWKDEDDERWAKFLND